jgi:hypothetical protein
MLPERCYYSSNICWQSCFGHFLYNYPLFMFKEKYILETNSVYHLQVTFNREEWEGKMPSLSEPLDEAIFHN